MELHLDTLLRALSTKRMGGGLAGLEFGPEGIAVAKARPDSASGPALNYAAFHAEPNTEKQPQLLKQLVAEQGWRGAHCNVVLHPSQYQITQIEAPDVPEHEWREALRWRLRDTFGASPDDLAFDIKSLPENAYPGRNRMVLLVAMPRKAMEKIVNQITMTGLTLRSIDITEHAMRNLSNYIPFQPSAPKALLRMRNSGSMLTVTDNSCLYFSRAMDIGLETIRREQDIAAGQLRALDTLALEIQRSLDFFESQCRRGRVGKLYLLPFKQPVAGLSDFLRERLAVETGAYPVNTNLLPEGPWNEREIAYCLGAMGAALRRDNA